MNIIAIFGAVLVIAVVLCLVCPVGRLNGRKIVLAVRDICEREPDHDLFLPVFAELHSLGLPVDPGVAEKVLSGEAGVPMSRDEAIKRIVAAKSLHGSDPARSEKLLEEIAESQAEVVPTAAEALLEVRDLPHPRFLLDDLQDRLGLDALGDTEKTVWLADRCGYLLSVDYLYRFDSEEEGNRLQEMHHALVSVGAAKAAARLMAYMELYGPVGPPATVAQRSKIAEAKGDDWGRSIAELEELHDGWEDITHLAIRYELRHGERFHKASEIRKILKRPEGPSMFNR